MDMKYIPFGPRVTLTALARTSTPLRMLALPSFENLISLCAPRASTGFAARRRDLEEVVDRRCIGEKQKIWDHVVDVTLENFSQLDLEIHKSITYGLLLRISCSCRTCAAILYYFEWHGYPILSLIAFVCHPLASVHGSSSSARVLSIAAHDVAFAVAPAVALAWPVWPAPERAAAPNAGTVDCHRPCPPLAQVQSIHIFCTL